MTDPIKAKIQELCPDVMEGEEMCSMVSCPLNTETKELPITLAVVLRAMGKKDFPIGNTELVSEEDLPVLKLVALWNLEHDDYDQQSEECKQFIGSLILN